MSGSKGNEKIIYRKKQVETTVSGSEGLNSIEHSQRTVTQVNTWDNQGWNSNWGSNKQELSQGSGLTQGNRFSVNGTKNDNLEDPDIVELKKQNEELKKKREEDLKKRNEANEERR